MRSFIFVLACLLPAAAAQAVPSGTWFTESELARKYDEVIFPFWKDEMATGTLIGKNGVHLSYKKYIVPNERGALVLVSGYAQSHVQFAELMYGFTQAGYSVYIVDNRGQGFSQRLLRNPNKIHISSFYDYVDDLKIFMDAVVKPRTHRRTILLAHSMGGQIAMLYQTIYPGELDAMVVDSPLVAINPGKIVGIPLSETDAKVIATAIPFRTAYAFGQHDPNWSRQTLANQTMTHSAARFDVKLKEWHRYPITKMGGATFGWISHTTRTSAWMRGHTPAKMTLPVLMLTAGVDSIVVPKLETWMCNRMPNCKQLRFPAAYHEILWETDAIRDTALAEISNFLEQQTR